MSKRQRVRVSLLARPDTSPSTLLGLYDVLNSVGVGWERTSLVRQNHCSMFKSSPRLGSLSSVQVVFP